MLKNFYTATSAEPGDVFACVVTCHVTPMGTLSFYRCEYPPDLYDGVPQGMFYGDNTDEVKLQDLFPTIRDHVLGYE